MKTLLIFALCIFNFAFPISPAFAQASDINPLSTPEDCPLDQPTTGSPLACTVGPHSNSSFTHNGHSYLRYIGNDSNNNPLCGRSFCLDGQTLKPFETTCSTDEANTGGTPVECTSSTGVKGLSYLRYSFSDTSNQAYCFRSECIVTNSSPSPTHPPTSGSLNPTSGPTNLSPEEQALLNFTKGTQPESIEEENKKQSYSLPNPIQNLLAGVQGLLDRFNHFVGRSSSLNQAQTPSDLKPEPNLNPIEKIKILLGGSSGVYGNTTVFTSSPPPGVPIKIGPKDIDGTDPVNSSEKFFEQSYFPPGVNPVTKDK